MAQVASAVREAGADLGAALNVDGDRIGFVTGDGTALSEEYSLPLVAAPRLRRRSGPVVTNYSTSGMVEAMARSHGQRVIRGPVGEGQIVDLGLAEGAVLAGEGSGGIAVLPTSVAYDGLLALGLVLEELATGDRSLAELAAGLPVLRMCKQELPCPPNLVYRVIERFRRHHADDNPDCTDGVRLVWEDAWLHVRASGTEPLLRIIAEAAVPERAVALVEEAAAFARSVTAGPEGS
jgi:phosphomannomutase